ncbi:15-hydroxyprostaglandin dehydrogenase [NAD(+)]-like [Galleria mellonella]|uniref:15-hydroxyprostaglandin dehydrogenase [NAD(+)]-like n=1 Tax=Galleria mellonella TaxID=7137 RepID=A0ABM3MTM8_GALME|nr:15-hydroxyprostaglandin dehydrogenase [NAD(+)]-like [Galleria mellonella]
MYQVTNKVVLVTGGAAGIGAGLVREFLQEGAKHVAALDVDVNSGKELEIELSSKYGANKVKFYKCDVTTEELNITALITSSLRAHKLMSKDNGGSGGTIINISSIVGLFQTPFLPIYAATKSAVLQFSTSLGAEENYLRFGVRVITICFGVTDTSLIIESKTASYDTKLNERLMTALKGMKAQRPESAVRGLLEAYKNGSSGSTWLIISDKPAEDITANINQGYKIFSRGVFE